MTTKGIGKVYKTRSKRRKPVNPKLIEGNPDSFSILAKKLKLDNDVPEIMSTEYLIRNFVNVFNTLNLLVRCKDWRGEFRFETTTLGLRFKIIVSCNECPAPLILSRPFEQNSIRGKQTISFYNENPWPGLKDARLFCCLMDLSFFSYFRTRMTQLLKICMSVLKWYLKKFFSKLSKNKSERLQKKRAWKIQKI